MYESIANIQSPRSANESTEDDESIKGAKGKVKGMMDSLVKCMISPTSRWVTIAAIIRTFGGIAVATYLPLYYLKVYPDYKQ